MAFLGAAPFFTAWLFLIRLFITLCSSVNVYWQILFKLGTGKSSNEFSSMAEDVICNEYLNPLAIMNNELQNDTGECISITCVQLMK